ncbi:LuxR C-terminal-related transcriptional regulator [Niabella hirudinis]
MDTVKTHRKNLMRKLECKNSAELMIYKVFI